jgi:hypothetical protein
MVEKILEEVRGSETECCKYFSFGIHCNLTPTFGRRWNFIPVANIVSYHQAWLYPSVFAFSHVVFRS